MSKCTGLPQFIRDLLAAPPHRGDGLNNWFFKVARYLHAFREHNDIVQLLEAAADGEPVKGDEIERAVERSKSCAWQPGQSQRSRIHVSRWPSLNVSRRNAIIADGGGLYDLWEMSPVRFDDDFVRTEELIDRLFPGDPLLCCGLSKSEFDTRSREEWRGELSELAVIVPSPMTARTGLTQDGKQSAHSKANTGPRRFLVIEFDKGSVDEHAALLFHLSEHAPLALAVHSGNKSLHGWFACQDRTEPQLRQFMSYAVSLGADRQLWIQSQFVRMPDGTRENGSSQIVHFFNPGAARE
jgi:hypothetical protein